MACHPAGHAGWCSALPYGFTTPSMIIVPPPPEIVDMAATIAAAAAASVGLSPQALAIPPPATTAPPMPQASCGAPGGSPSNAGGVRGLGAPDAGYASDGDSASGYSSDEDDDMAPRGAYAAPSLPPAVPPAQACDLGLAAVANAPVLLVPAGFRLARVDVADRGTAGGASAPAEPPLGAPAEASPLVAGAEYEAEAQFEPAGAEVARAESPTGSPAGAASPAHAAGRAHWPGSWVGPLPMGDSTPVFSCPAVSAPVLLPAVVVCQAVLAGKCTVTPLRMPYEHVDGVAVPESDVGHAGAGEGAGAGARLTGRIRSRSDHEETPRASSPTASAPVTDSPLPQRSGKRARLRYA